MKQTLIFATSSEVIQVPIDALVFIRAEGNYSAITMADGCEYVLTMQLGQIESRIADCVTEGDNRFVRIGKSLIINIDFVTLINPTRQRLTLSDCRTFHHDVSASREALRSLKDFIEKGVSL